MRALRFFRLISDSAETRHEERVRRAGGRLALFLQLRRSAHAHEEACATCRAARREPGPGAILTDGVHLWSQNAATLHRLARQIGLRRSWYQEAGVNIPDRGRSHYDLTSMRTFHLACLAGAVLVESTEFVQRVQHAQEE